jgi:hypothetical protein
LSLLNRLWTAGPTPAVFLGIESGPLKRSNPGWSDWNAFLKVAPPILAIFAIERAEFPECWSVRMRGTSTDGAKSVDL